MFEQHSYRSGTTQGGIVTALALIAGATTSAQATGCAPALPPNAIIEAEPNCGVPNDVYNGGCRSPINAALTVPPNATIVGTLTDDIVALFDTDTYEFTVAAPGGNVTVQAWASFPVYAVIDDLNCSTPLLAVGLSDGCNPATATILALPPGKHRMMVTSSPGILPCGSGYTATIKTCPCPGDLNGDCIINTPDLVTFLGRFGKTDQAPYSLGDLNNDRKIDTADLVTFLGRFGCDGR
jgi:hypothetical protein